jgi:NAD-dependent SIR2 family protein deacetylase
MFDQMRGLAPNDAHVAIETLAGKSGAFAVTVVTQNIDGLHQRAALDSRTSTETIELHGSTRRVECLDQCGWSEDAETFLSEWDDAADDEEEEARDGGRKRRRARASSGWISSDAKKKA